MTDQIIILKLIKRADFLVAQNKTWTVHVFLTKSNFFVNIILIYNNTDFSIVMFDNTSCHNHSCLSCSERYHSNKHFSHASLLDMFHSFI